MRYYFTSSMKGISMKLLTLFAIFFISSFSDANSSLPNNRHIAITGVAKLSVVPDIVVLSLEAESLKKTSVMAKKDLDKRINTFLEGLSAFDIDESNVSASDISIRENTSYTREDGNKLIGYKASRHLTLTFDDIEKLSELLDFALALQLNEVRSINLKSSQAVEYQNKVSTLALRNAQDKADLFAKALQAKVTHVYSINSNRESQHYTYGGNALMDRAEIKSLSRETNSDLPGKYLKANIVFSSSVNVVFDIDVQTIE